MNGGQTYHDSSKINDSLLDEVDDLSGRFVMGYRVCLKDDDTHDGCGKMCERSERESMKLIIIIFQILLPHKYFYFKYLFSKDTFFTLNQEGSTSHPRDQFIIFKYYLN